MKLVSLTLLGFEVNAMWDACPDFELTFDEVHLAASERKLVAMLAERFKGSIDLSLLIGNPKELSKVEAALGDASYALQGQERRKVGVSSSGLCLVMAIIFEAIQQRFCPLEK